MANREVDRQGFVNEFAELLGGGHTLVRSQIAEIITNYGYSESSVNDVINNVRTVRALEEAGVILAVDSHRSTRIYRDGQRPLEETDIEETIRQIDRERTESIAKMKRTRGIE